MASPRAERDDKYSGSGLLTTQSLRSFFNELDHADLNPFCQALFMNLEFINRSHAPKEDRSACYTGQSQVARLVSHIFQNDQHSGNTVQDSVLSASRICVLDGVL